MRQKKQNECVANYSHVQNTWPNLEETRAKKACQFGDNFQFFKVKEEEKILVLDKFCLCQPRKRS